ncbi:MAG: ZIP family metal transporter [Planctomycetaceae bacterium]
MRSSFVLILLAIALATPSVALAQPIADEPAVAETASSSTTWILVTYSVLIVLSSMLGGWLPSILRLTHVRMQMLMSVVGGLMLGIGLFHLLPHGLHELGPGGIDRGVWWMVIGVVTMFLLIRMFHFHSHDVPDPEHDHDCDKAHGDDTQHSHSHGHHGHNHGTHELSWLGVFFGLSLHTLIDGLALGASIQADAAHGGGFRLFGLGTFAAIALHKPLDAISITTLMKSAGWSRIWMNVVNAAFATMCPLGALLFVFGLSKLGANQSVVIGCALTFSAGVFLCISLGDLLPEMEFHSHNRLQLSGLLIAGLAIAYGIGFLEPAHVHNHGHDPVEDTGHDHDHAGHDH